VPARVAPVLTAILPHIVRNAIAHGIETPGKREHSGKAKAGTIQLVARESEGSLTVAIRDDGSGLDEAAIAEQGRQLGLREGNPSDLLFAAGLSTAPKVTELAGQGIGLAAVRANLSRVGAEIRVRSERGRGTDFEITVAWTADA
jgi:chemotaxis protein histidine kinase CheA